MHPSQSLLWALAAGRLLREEAERLTRHIDECAACRNAYASLQSACDSLRDRDQQLNLASGDAPTASWEPAADPEATPALRSQAALPGLGNRIQYVGDYELIDQIGRGGMGVVYLARQISLQRLVALKLLAGADHAAPEDVQRFQREAEAVAKLDHPGIVPIYEVGRYENWHYYSMGFVDGETLDQKLKAADGPLPTTEAARLLSEITRAVAYAHRMGVIHRDLKPSNVLLDATGTPRVADFGLAKRLGLPDDLTRTGVALGTPSYMPPEQARGDSSRVNASADVYSLGAMLYCLVTGRPPFQAADAMETMRQVVEQEPVSPRLLNPQTPRDIETICLKCLEKAPEQRYASAADLADELDRYLRGEPILARPVGPLGRGVKWCRRNPVVAALLAAIAVSLVVGMATSSTLAYIAWNEAGRANANASTAQQATQHAKQQQALAETAEEETRVEAAKAAFAQGLTEQTGGRLENAERSFYRAWRMLSEDHPLEPSYRQVAWNAVRFRGGEMAAPPLRHDTWPVGAGFVGEGKLVFTHCGKVGRLWSMERGTPLAQILQHPEHIRNFQVSPDHRQIATLSGNSILLWDARSGKNAGETLMHPEQVLRAAYLKDATRLATSCADRKLRVWDTTTGKLAFDPVPHDGVAVKLFASQDGTSLVTLHDEVAMAGQPRQSFLQAWNATTGELRVERWAEPFAGDPPLPFLDVSRDAKRLLTLGKDQAVVLWNLETKQREGEPFPKAMRAWFSESGKKVVAVGYEKPNPPREPAGATAVVYDIDSRKPIVTVRHETAIFTAKLSADERWLLTWHTGETEVVARCWNVTDGKLQGQPLRHELPPFPQSVGLQDAVGMSADGKRILVSVGQKVHVWRTPKPVPDRVLFRHPGQVLNVILSPDGKLIATTCSDGNVRLWDVASRTLAFPPMPHPEVMRWLTFSPGGKWLASTNKKGEARVWDVATGAVVGEVFPHANMGLTFSPDETLLATAGGGKEINGDANRGRVWEVATGKLVMHTTPYRFSASAVDFSADGKRLLTGSIDGAAQIWEVASGREIATLLSPPNEQTSPADGGPLQVARFSPDGSKALTADANGTMRLWDGHTGRPVGQVMRNNLSILSAVFSPDGRRIATGSMDKTARLWDVETTTEIAVMRHDTYVLVLAFRPDGRQLLTGTEGAEVRLWDGWTGAPLGMPMPTYGKPGNVAFSPDGKKMLTAGSDTAQLWDSLLEPPSHIVMDRMLQLWTGQETTRTGRSRTLTNKEWLQLFDEEPAGSD